MLKKRNDGVGEGIGLKDWRKKKELRIDFIIGVGDEKGEEYKDKRNKKEKDGNGKGWIVIEKEKEGIMKERKDWNDELGGLSW